MWAGATSSCRAEKRRRKCCKTRHVLIFKPRETAQATLARCSLARFLATKTAIETKTRPPARPPRPTRVVGFPSAPAFLQIQPFFWVRKLWKLSSWAPKWHHNAGRVPLDNSAGSIKSESWQTYRGNKITWGRVGGAPLAACRACVKIEFHVHALQCSAPNALAHSSGACKLHTRPAHINIGRIGFALEIKYNCAQKENTSTPIITANDMDQALF